MKDGFIVNSSLDLAGQARLDPKIGLLTKRNGYHGLRVIALPREAGWKDTVHADPAMVTRIILRFEGYTGRYVWHCHILEHEDEDNEMMRPYEVIAAP
jgi:FtsP/CotA-like multicopper oxidase with cupredoxin domain